MRWAFRYYTDTIATGKTRKDYFTSAGQASDGDIFIGGHSYETSPDAEGRIHVLKVDVDNGQLLYRFTLHGFNRGHIVNLTPYVYVAHETDVFFTLTDSTPGYSSF